MTKPKAMKFAAEMNRREKRRVLVVHDARRAAALLRAYAPSSQEAARVAHALETDVVDLLTPIADRHRRNDALSANTEG